MLYRQVLTGFLLSVSFLSIAQEQKPTKESPTDTPKNATTDPSSQPTPSPSESTPETEQNPATETNMNDGSEPLSDKIIDEIVNKEDESSEELTEDSYIDLNVLLGRRWYQDSPFRSDTAQLTTEWAISDLPLRAGPSISFSKLDPDGIFFQKGQIVELGARITAFWDTKWALPYISLDYTLLSSGSVNGLTRTENTTTEGNLELSSPGYTLLVGTSIFLKDYSIIIETAVASSKNIDLDGGIGTISELDGEVTFDNQKASSFKNDQIKSLMIGVGFEI